MWLSEEGSTTFTYARILTERGSNLKKNEKEMEGKKEEESSILFWVTGKMMFLESKLEEESQGDECSHHIKRFSLKYVS